MKKHTAHEPLLPISSNEVPLAPYSRMDNSAILFAFDVADPHLPTTSSSAPPEKASVEHEDRLRGNEGYVDVESEQAAINDKMSASTAWAATGTPFRATPAPELVESCAGTPPISIAMSKSASQDCIAAKHERDLEHTMIDNTPTLDHMTMKSANRKKKRAQKKSALAALSTVRGFTPATSADEESDFCSPGVRGRKESAAQRSSSVVRKDLNLQGLSPGGPRPETRSSSPSGLSALSQQLESMRSRSPSLRPIVPRKKSKLASETPSSASVTSETDGGDDETQITSYEVRLENDFISSAVTEKERREARQDAMFNGGVVRKMQATDFEPLRCLGKGTYGTVLLVKQVATGKLYAQKAVQKGVPDGAQAPGRANKDGTSHS